MERSGDVIAVKPLRPVFLYCFTVGCSIVISYVISSMQASLFGSEGFRRALLFLILGAFWDILSRRCCFRKRLLSSGAQKHGCASAQYVWFLCLALRRRGMTFWDYIPACRR